MDQARSLLGPHAVLLPVKAGTKVVALKRWQETTLLDTAAGTFQERLQIAPAVAVLLGPPSRDLIGIDFDHDEAAQEFMALNPALAKTLRTKGARGCALWLIIVGAYPDCVTRLKDAAGKALGEWRGGNCYSLISGQHPHGQPYTVLTQASPVATTFQAIRWPEGWSVFKADETPLEVDVPSTQRGRADPLGRKRREREAIQKPASSIGYDGNAGDAQKKPQQKPFAKTHPDAKGCNDPSLMKLYERYIDDHWTPSPSRRNEFIVKAVPFLFHAMCESAVMALVMRYYDINRQHFNDSRETHQAEASAHLRNVAARFRLSLTPCERRFYDACRSERKRAAYRICRYLSKRPSNRSECGEGDFFLSCADLGGRLLMDPKGAGKLLRWLVKAGVLLLVRKGKLWEKGHRPQATSWRFLLQSSP